MPFLHVVAIRRLEDQLAPLRGLVQEPEHILLWQVNAQSAETFLVQHRIRSLFFKTNHRRDEQTEGERGTKDGGYLHVHLQRLVRRCVLRLQTRSVSLFSTLPRRAVV